MNLQRLVLDIFLSLAEEQQLYIRLFLVAGSVEILDGRKSKKKVAKGF